MHAGISASQNAKTLIIPCDSVDSGARSAPAEFRKKTYKSLSIPNFRPAARTWESLRRKKNVKPLIILRGPGDSGERSVPTELLKMLINPCVFFNFGPRAARGNLSAAEMQ